MRKAKRWTPLMDVMQSVTCMSLANGQILVTPKWLEAPVEPDATPVGVITRLYAARHLQRLINAHLKGKR